MESVRWQGLKHGFAYYPDFQSGSEYAMFVASQVYELSEAVHNIRYAEAFGRHFPIRCYMYVSDVGRSTYCVTVKWIDFKSDATIATFITKVVMVNRKTRRPVQLPEIFYKDLDKHLRAVEQCKIDKRVLIAFPENAFTYQLKAYQSDTDWNGHVNQATYIRWCSDAAAVAAIQKHLNHFSRHIELYPCKIMEIHHYGEALVNDELEVVVWEPGMEKCLKVAIKCKGKVIFTMDLEFHKSLPVEVAPHLDSQL